MQDGVVQKAKCVLSIDLSKSSWIFYKRHLAIIAAIRIKKGQKHNFLASGKLENHNREEK